MGPTELVALEASAWGAETVVVEAQQLITLVTEVRRLQERDESATRRIATTEEGAIRARSDYHRALAQAEAAEARSDDLEAEIVELRDDLDYERNIHIRQLNTANAELRDALERAQLEISVWKKTVEDLKSMGQSLAHHRGCPFAPQP